ncbi:MAG: electron transfer flavoprotein-ubiquinone oxidoreductase [Pseudomonadota bacterium]
MAERERMDFDVVIVGAGPAGLATAIALRDAAPDATIVVVEKGSEVGAHILSGVVVDPSGLDRVTPDWASDPDFPLTTTVTRDRFALLGPAGEMAIPNALMPPLMSNHTSRIGSLSDLTKWLAARAEAADIEIYPGFAATELLIENGAVTGIATGDMGLLADGTPGPNHEPGMELGAKYVVLAEGVRGSLTKQAMAQFGLAEGREPQKFGLGMKELWRVDDAVFEPGLVQHTMGWPLGKGTGGGSFMYHFGDNLMSLGFVVHLNYKNPHLDPFMEFQRFKTHLSIKPYLEGAKRVGYGARAISEGGFQSVPKLAFPGGCLVGCGAGFVNVPRIKGTHNAMQSGAEAAAHIAAALADGRANDNLTAYDEGWREGPVGRDLYPVRNAKPLWSKYGMLGGLAAAALDMWTHTLFNRSLFGTVGHGGADHEALQPGAKMTPIKYPKPDGIITFDRASSVYLSNTNHEDNQPVHLKVKDLDLQMTSELSVFAAPSSCYCPAGVYEWDLAGEAPRFVINAQNCVHCKTCDIKDPNQNITWVPPEGGGGPNYQGM